MDPLHVAVPLVTGIAREPRALWLGSTALLAAAAVSLTDWDAPTDS